MPASGFSAYEDLVLAYYNGVATDSVDGVSNVEPALNTLRTQLTSHGVSSSALKNYENLLVAQNNNMISPLYDGDNNINNILATARATLIASYSGP